MKQHNIKNDDSIIRDILEQVDTPEYDISGNVLKYLRTTPEEEKQNKRKQTILKPVKIVAAIAAVILIVGLFNITTVIAFFKSLFYIPGVGFTENDLPVAMLDEPVEINCDLGKLTLEFITKVKHEADEDDKADKCEILLYFTSREEKLLSIISNPLDAEGYYEGTNYTMQDLSASALVNGETIYFNFDGSGGGNPHGNGIYAYLNMSSNDFPDINEFDLQFRNTTTHITLSELNDGEKTTYTSNEINGIKLAVYKFRQNNKIIGLDIINSNDLGEFYAGSPDIFINSVTGEQETEIQVISNGKYIQLLDNESDTELTGIKDISFLRVDYMSERVPGDGDLLTVTTRPHIHFPIPKDGEILQTDIKIPVGGTFYEITEVRRDGDIIYYKDNCIMHDVENFDMEYAAANNGVYILDMRPYYLQGLVYYDEETKSLVRSLEIDQSASSITGFNPDDESFDININTITVIYFGDFSVDLTQK